ncbi:Arginine--tRNA ligase [Aquicella siphonis]|uniref:Arginine--tRNA ligase n=1 Tax=Aquicella siphonis TaxID=254247 RepID=A0A5E4PFG2_9COXI|nr:arginine--tRNA ligase [Aquicella siphonis]VVC75091.1 Arginine--tRNA ligase [Aquicella siphonis]
MKQHIETLIHAALKTLQESGDLPEIPSFVLVEGTKDKQHGDFATNIALVMAKSAQKKPREVAERIMKALPASQYVRKTEVAGPGFINFFLTPDALSSVVAVILKEKEAYGRSKIGREKRVLVEFLSSNPTGPLHVGHGRGGAFGAVVSNLLDAVGFKTYREYYVNDAGRQMDILTVSIWLRYLALCGEQIVFPANAYRGDYVIDIAKAIHGIHGSHFLVPASQVYAGLPPDEPQGGDKEIYIDAIIAQAKRLLADQYETVFTLGLDNVLGDIREDLAEFGVHYDNWFSEREFVATDVVDKLLEKLKDSGHVYEKDGALWFRSTDFKDEKDRVLVRSNGQRTYFANDVAYHLSKFERGFDIVIDIFGADHHGYVPRMKAAMEASGINPERLLHLLLQFVTLYRGGSQVQMSTRSGTFVTLRELREEVGNDAARFFYVMRKSEQHIDFDLDLAKAQSNENPVYYVQYAYARICSVFKQLAERQLLFDEANGVSHLNLLTQPQEQQLLNALSRYPEVITSAALQYEPHQLTNYVRDLAADFHAYYNSHQFIVEEASLRDARLALVAATRQTLLNGFNLLGISAPESM